MHAIRFLLPAVCLAALVSAGCAAMQRGTTVVKHDSTTAPITTEAPMDGNYSLYDATDVSPKVTVFLEKGKPIGFERDSSSGRIQAVYGNEKLPLSSEGTHYWRRR